MLRLLIPSYPLGLVLRRAAVAYLITWSLLPQLAYGTLWRLLTVVAAGVWLLLDLRVARSVVLRPSRAVLLMWLFVFYTLGVEFIVPDGSNITRHFQMWIMFFFLLVGEGARRRGDEELRFLFWAVLLILPIALVSSIYGLEYVDSRAARAIVRSSQEAKELAAQGIGGFSLVYAVVLALPFLTQLAWFGKRSWQSLTYRPALRRAQRALVIANWVLCMYLVLSAGYTIAMMLAVFSVVVVALVRSRQAVKFGMSTTLAACIAMGAYVSVNPILDGLMEVTQGTPYYIKVRDLRYSYNSNEDVGTVGDRSERYLLSARKFIENPVAGTLDYVDVGKHSAVLDRFGEYGLFAGGIFLYLMVLMPLRALRDSRVPIGVTLGFCVAGVGFPFLNPIFPAWGLMLYVFSMGSIAVMGVSSNRFKHVTPQDLLRDNE